MTDALTIAPATGADLSDLAALHRASWASAYAGMVPPEALGAPLDAHMARTWSDLPSGVLLARQRGRAVGFVRLIDKKGWPYVDNLHVRPDLKGGGIGRALMGSVVARLRARGAGRLWLTVVMENRGARAFYRRLGGYEGARMREVLLGAPVDTHPVIWTRLGPLEEACK
jgi:ribosomal protein S18 acetylase RimI-like enzyme